MPGSLLPQPVADVVSVVDPLLDPFKHDALVRSRFDGHVLCLGLTVLACLKVITPGWQLRQEERSF